MGKRWVDLTVALGLGLLGFGLTYTSGSRGFFAFDQSIVFDGSYRIVSGQIPYKDFLMPFGPVTFLLHALFFKLFGITYHAYLVGSATIALVASVLSVCILILLKANPVAVLAGGIVTSVWFYPPFGTPWVDQTALFFSMLAIWLSLLALHRSSRPLTYAFLCGLAWLASFLSKQNIGAFIFLLFPLLFLGTEGRHGLKKAVFFVFGICFGCAVFLVWLFLFSDPAAFLDWFFILPSRLGTERLSSLLRIGFGLIKPYFDGRGSLVMNIMAMVCFLVGILGLRSLGRRAIANPDIKKNALCCSILSTYIPVFQHIFINTTLNQADNGFGLSGLCFGNALTLLMGWRRISKHDQVEGLSDKPLKIIPMGSAKALIGGVVVIVGLSTASGVKVSMERRVHDIFQGASFANEIEIDRLKPLRWAKPTAMGGYEITEESIVALTRYLNHMRSRFFIFPDFTIFYGLLGVPSPQPLLWFHQGVTFSGEDNRWLDRKVRRALEQSQVEIVVLEQVSWFNTGKRLDKFPETKAYIFTNFTPVERIGTFLVYRKRHSSFF